MPEKREGKVKSKPGRLGTNDFRDRGAKERKGITGRESKKLNKNCWAWRER